MYVCMYVCARAYACIRHTIARVVLLADTAKLPVLLRVGRVDAARLVGGVAAGG